MSRIINFKYGEQMSLFASNNEHMCKLPFRSYVNMFLALLPMNFAWILQIALYISYLEHVHYELNKH